MERTTLERTAGHRVDIVGGGVAGLFAARTLHGGEVAIILVDRAQLLIRIAFLTGFRNRVGAVLTWAAFARAARRERTFTTGQIERLRDVHGPSSGTDRPTVPSGTTTAR
jgi:flavin-dependent dehydrogenase